MGDAHVQVNVGTQTLAAGTQDKPKPSKPLSCFTFLRNKLEISQLQPIDCVAYARRKLSSCLTCHGKNNHPLHYLIAHRGTLNCPEYHLDS